MDQTQIIRWDTVFPICRHFITFSATSADLYSWSKELQFKWQAWYYCWMWWTMWVCTCLQLGAAVQEPYLVGINNWWVMCMDQLSKCNCIVHRQARVWDRGPVCADVVVLVLFGIGCMVEDWVLCANVFIGKGSCRVEGWALCANAFIGKGSCRVEGWVPCANAFIGKGSCMVEDWVLCANVFIGKGSCRVEDWVPVCTDAIALLDIGCRIEDWVPKGSV